MEIDRGGTKEENLTIDRLEWEYEEENDQVLGPNREI